MLYFILNAGVKLLTVVHTQWQKKIISHSHILFMKKKQQQSTNAKEQQKDACVWVALLVDRSDCND